MAINQTGSNNHAPVLFRSYTNPLEGSEIPSIKLWEAARATSAAPSYFTPLKVGDYTFLDGGLQANSPLGWYVPIHETFGSQPTFPFEPRVLTCGYILGYGTKS